MYDDIEVTNGILQVVNNSLKPWLELINGDIYLSSLFIFLLFLVIAKIVNIAINLLQNKFGKHHGATLKCKLLAAFRSPFIMTIFLIGVGTVFSRMNITEYTYETSLSIIASLAIIIWSHFLIKTSRIGLTSLAYQKNNTSMVHPESLPLFKNTSIILIVSLAIFKLFRIWDIDMTTWLASAGIIGIAVGFAAKDTLANFFSGIFILLDAPYKIGDYIIVDNSERGMVTNIGIRSTRILTRDDVEVTIPNSIMGNTKIINESGGPHKKYRIRVKVSIAYGTNIENVRNILLDVAKKEPRICIYPEPRVRMREFGDSGLLLELLCWIDEPVLRGASLDAINEAVYNRFIEEDIEIPYNKQEIFIKSLPERNIEPTLKVCNS